MTSATKEMEGQGNESYEDWGCANDCSDAARGEGVSIILSVCGGGIVLCSAMDIHDGVQG